jgi:CheY-like chemotaxis protein
MNSRRKYLSNYTILYVEDEEMIRDYLKKMLSRFVKEIFTTRS